MMNIQTIQHVADCVPLYMPHSLYLKPLAKLNISVALPLNKMGKSISNLDIMEKLSHALKPDKFLVLKVSKTTVDFIRFEAELDDRSRLRSCINRLDGVSLKISGFHESFRVRVSEAKDEFPTRHDWDSFFRDAHKMDEMKAGERPDTIHITHLPIKWFCPRHMENDDNVKPSEGIFKRIFEKFGCIRCVDIPICDPYRNKMNTDINGMKSFGFDQEILFEAYVQFDEYVGFVRAMDEFRGMKLVKKFIDKTQAINIGVTFDTTKHLSDAQIQRRERVRKHIIAKAKAEEEEVERKKKMELLKLEEQKQKEEQEKLAELERQREREEKRKEKHLKKIQEKGSIEISQKIRVEERKLMIAQRKLESIRILEQLFSRIKLKHLAKHGSTSSQKYQMEMARDTMRERLVEKYKTATEKLLSDQQKLVDDIKNKTPLMGLLKSKKDKEPIPVIPKVGNSTGEAVPAIANPAAAAVAAANVAAAGNPFKTIAALGANYNTEAASEWMKSLSMFSYGNIPALFPGLAPMYRPPTFPVSVNYRGFAPRIRGRGRGRGGRGRGYEGQSSSSHYSKYHYNNDDRDRRYDDDEDGGSYHKSYSRGRRYSRSRSRSRSRDRRSRSRSRSSRSRSRDRRSRSRSSRSRSRDRRSRSRSRSRSRHRHYSKRSRSRSRSYSRSESKSRSRSRSRDRSRDDKNRSKSSRSKSPIQQRPPEKVNRKLVSTRRSRSSSHESRSRSRSRTHSKRSWSRRDNSSRDRRSSPAPRKVVIETEELVKSAEIIKSTIEKDMQERIRNEKREIRETFTKRHKDVLAHNATNQTIIINNSSSASNVDSGHATSEHSANESAQDKNSSRDERDERDDRDDKRSSRRDRYHSTSSDHHRHSSYKHNSERENSSQNTSSGDRYSRHNSTSDNHSNNKHPTTEHNSRRRSSERSSKQRRSSERSGTTIKHKSPPPVSSHKKTSGRNLRLASLDRSPSC